MHATKKQKKRKQKKKVKTKKKNKKDEVEQLTEYDELSIFRHWNFKQKRRGNPIVTKMCYKVYIPFVDKEETISYDYISHISNFVWRTLDATSLRMYNQESKMMLMAERQFRRRL